MAMTTDNGQEYLLQTEGYGWELHTIGSYSWHGVAWSESLGLAVAVGENGALATSSNGSDWTLQTFPNSQDWQAVCWADTLGLFVAVARDGTGNRVMTSPDGVNWTSRTSAADIPWYGVAWSNSQGLLVAVGQAFPGTNHVMTSTDGITWVSRTATTSSGSGFDDVAYSPSLDLWVMAGDGGEIHSSPDGITWTQRFTGSFWWHGVTWSATYSLFQVVGASDGYKSTDGITWVNADVTDGWNAWSVAADDEQGGMAALRAGNAMSTSDNSIPWEVSALTPNTTDGEALVYAPSLNKFIGVYNFTYGPSPDRAITGSYQTGVNSLWKPIERTYIPGTAGSPGQPYIPETPGYWSVVETTVRNWYPLYVNRPCESFPLSEQMAYGCRIGDQVRYLVGWYSEDVTTYTNVWNPPVPAQPYIAPTPPTQGQILEELNAGWNSFSVSSDIVTTDAGGFWLYVPESTAGAFVGLIPSNDPGDISPYNIRYGAYITNGSLYAYEQGVGLTYVMSGIDDDLQIDIYRAAGVIYLDVDYNPAHTFVTPYYEPLKLQANLWQGGDAITGVDYFDVGLPSVAPQGATVSIASVIGFGAEGAGGEEGEGAGSISPVVASGTLSDGTVLGGVGEGAGAGDEGWGYGSITPAAAGLANFGFHPGLDAQETYAAGVTRLQPVSSFAGGSSSATGGGGAGGGITGGITADLPPPVASIGMAFVAAVGGVGVGEQLNSGSATVEAQPVTGLGFADFAGNVGEGAPFVDRAFFSLGNGVQIGEGFTVGVFGYAVPSLPALTLQANGDPRATSVGGDVTLPVPTLAGYGGGSADLTLPATTLAITATWPGIGRVAARLPALTLSASGTTALGPATTTLTLPALQVTGRVSGWRFDIDLPAMTLTASGLRGMAGTASLTLPALGLQSDGNYSRLPVPTVQGYGGGTGAVSLPAATFSGAATILGANGTLAARLPALRVAATGQGAGKATIVLPAFTMTSSGNYMELTVPTVAGYGGGSSAFDLPAVTFLGTGLAGAITKTTVLKLPVPTVTASGSVGWVIGVRLPALTVAAQASVRQTAGAGVVLPVPTLEASDTAGDKADITLPLLRLVA